MLDRAGCPRSALGAGHVAPTTSGLKYGQGTFYFTSSGIDGMVGLSWPAPLPRRQRWKRP